VSLTVRIPIRVGSPVNLPYQAHGTLLKAPQTPTHVSLMVFAVKAEDENRIAKLVENSASSGESVGKGERQRTSSHMNRWNFLHVESKDRCSSSSP
jgi:hypothetical protein